MLPKHVTLVEVSPRDGLQNEARLFSIQEKVSLVSRLQAAGLHDIEVTSFVNPRWVPQMADGAQVMAMIQREPGIRYSVLVPNLKGWDAACLTRPDEIVLFAAASEAFSQRNINCSIEESMLRFEPVAQAAKAQGVKVRAVISCALGCPYQGEVSPDEMERVVKMFKALGADHCGVADTLGTGTPLRVQACMERALQHFPLHEVSGHFHDTYGQALANVYASLQMGVHIFDASVAGLGGCPYALGATGNVATEDVLFMLNGLGIETGIRLDALIDAVAWVSELLDRPPASRVGRALLARREAGKQAVMA